MTQRVDKSSRRALRGIAIVALLGTGGLVVAALLALAGRDYVGGGLVLMGAMALGHLGLELVALTQASAAKES